MRIHLEASKIYHTYEKKLRKCSVVCSGIGTTLVEKGQRRHDTAHPITGQVQGSGFSLKSCFLPRGPILLLFSEPSIAQLAVSRPSFLLVAVTRGLHAVLRAIYSTWWSIEALFFIECKDAASKGSKMSSLRPTWTEELFSEPSISWKNSGPLFYSMEGCRVQ